MSTYPPPPPAGYGAPPPPPGGKQRLRGRIPLRLALIFGIVGVVLVSIGAVVLAKTSLGKVDDFTRVSVADGSKVVEFSRTGSYVGYYETPSSASHRARVVLAITDAQGTPVRLALYGRNDNSSSSLTYDYHGRHGEALYKFKIKEPGNYRVAVRSEDAPPGANMAFGESIATGLIVGVLLIIPGILLVIAAIVLLIVGLVKRSRHKSELARYPYGAPPPGGAPGYPPPGYPPPGYPQQPGFGGPPGEGPSLSKG